MHPLAAKTGIVLSGGGARGAYEAGIVAGIIDILEKKPRDAAPFQVFAGTSVGAINASFLAASAHRGDMDVGGLIDRWESLRAHEHLKLDVWGFLGWPRSLPLRLHSGDLSAEKMGPRFGRSILNPLFLEELVRASIPWETLHDNVSKGYVHALVVAALHIGTGRTSIFAELAPGAEFRYSQDPRRISRSEPITADHVLASAALPLLFPARRVGNAYYCDGGLRFNTPIASAIRAGAERLVVVPLRRDFMNAAEENDGNGDATEKYPHPLFLMGKVLAALMLDPVAYDLQILERFNRLWAVLEETLTADELDEVRRILIETRGIAYRRLETLVFRPSRDIGRMATEHLRARDPEGAGGLLRWLLARAPKHRGTFEADLASFLLFDGAFATELVELGKQDAYAQADRIREFFAEPEVKVAR